MLWFVKEVPTLLRNAQRAVLLNLVVTIELGILELGLLMWLQSSTFEKVIFNDFFPSFNQNIDYKCAKQDENRYSSW